MQNLFIGKGNLADSPELKRLQGRDGEDFTVAKMRVMFARYGRDENGDMKQVDGFWRSVEIYGSKAEACAKFLRKGARVLVIGEERSFQAKREDGDETEQVIKIVLLQSAAKMYPAKKELERKRIGARNKLKTMATFFIRQYSLYKTLLAGSSLFCIVPTFFLEKYIGKSLWDSKTKPVDSRTC